MDAFNDRDVHHIVVMKSAQIGWTECINNVCGYVMHQDPGPMLVVQPTLDIAKAWSKDRLANMLRDTPALQGLVRERRSKDSENTVLHKVFPGGHITVAGANSPSSLASRPIRVVLLDEVDRYPISAGAEGDPRKLAMKRSTTFWNRKILEGGTPTIRGESQIEASFLASDQQYYFVPCPHCDAFQRLVWANVQWDKSGDEHKPDTAHYVCEHCGAVILDADKPGMLARGEWRPTAPFKGVRGFHINELYSPWVRFSEIVASFLEAKPMPETLQVWVNTALGETWEEDSEKFEPDDLQARAEPYERPPDAVLYLTCQVDVQDDRLEALVDGWGLGYESWTIEHRVFFGDPALSEIWKRLDEFLLRTWEREDGTKLRISCVVIDSGGHFTDEVYKFCRPRYGRRVYAIKGVGGVGRPIVSRPTKSNRQHCPVFSIGVDTAKDLLFSRMGISRPGPGYLHFHEKLDEEFFSQLTAEERREKYVQGHKTHYYYQRRARNEALDLKVYGLAAIELVGPDFDGHRRPPEPRAPQAIVQTAERSSWVGRRSGWIRR